MLYLLAFTFVMPLLAVVADLPGGLIRGAIIVFGMMRAWNMTAAPVVTVTGPYRIGAPAAGVSIIGLMIFFTGVPILWLVGAVAFWRALKTDPGPGHDTTVMTYYGLVIVLSFLARNVQ